MRHRLRISQLCLWAPLIAACSEEKAAQISPVDGLPDELAPELLREVAALDPRLDTDGDGLMDVDELVGWLIRVDETGRPQGILERRVFSDPDMADTDGDGVLDGVERMVGSDPDSTDTDGDGLSDYDEVYRWGTGPASVDSDGDARGQDPDPSAAADVTLFDGAELQLVDDPANPGGPKVAGPNATSPLHGDTDGDGVWDWAENGTRTRSSSIADTPRLLIGVTPNSRAGFYLNLTVTEETTYTEERGTELAFGGGVSSNIGNTTSHTLATWMDSLTVFGLLVNIEVNTEQAGADAGVYFEEEAGIGIKNSFATEFTADSTVSTQFSQVLNEVASDGLSRTQTIDGGRVSLLVDVSNVGSVPCKVRNLSMQLARFDPEIGKTRPVAQLRPSVGADNDLVLAVGETVAVQFEAREVDADRLMRLMANPGLMVLSPANYDVLTAGDEDYEFIEADVADRTARVTIELGAVPQVYDVAAMIGRDQSGRLEGVSVADVLDRVGITYDADPIEVDEALFIQEYIFKIGNVSTELHEGPAPDLGDPAYPEGKAPGPRPLKRGWYAVIERRDGAIEFDDQLFAARLLPGDRATLTFLEDKDRDGVSQREERLRGTSDDTIDSDGDGLSDWWELKVGHVVQVVGQVPRHTTSNPATKDTDKDGLDDMAELMAGTHPWVPDTDGDRIGDKQELDQTKNPLAYDSSPPAVRHCGVRPESWYVPNWRVEVDDVDVDLTEVSVTFEDGRVMTLMSPPTGIWSAHLASGPHITSIRATDARGLVTTRECP
ncbi:MAG TPA: hypothetical protein PK095_10465 [Myxococcota bacterium]|nr:hypothetical protein [Myxococcota bacterium]